MASGPANSKRNRLIKRYGGGVARLSHAQSSRIAQPAGPAARSYAAAGRQVAAVTIALCSPLSRPGASIIQGAAAEHKTLGRPASADSRHAGRPENYHRHARAVLGGRSAQDRGAGRPLATTRGARERFSFRLTLDYSYPLRAHRLCHNERHPVAAITKRRSPSVLREGAGDPR